MEGEKDFIIVRKYYMTGCKVCIGRGVFGANSVFGLIFVRFSAMLTEGPKRVHNGMRCTLRKKVLSRTLKGSSAQRSAETIKGSRGNSLEMVLGETLLEEP